MGDGTMILRVVLDKIDGYGIQYQKGKKDQCFISVDDQAAASPWSNVEDNTFTVPLHHLEANEARQFLKDRFASLSENGCLMVPYISSSNGKVRFGLIYYPKRTYMSFDNTNNMSQPFEPDALADYLIDIMLVEEVMGN
jgi:hypothetical protein